MKSRLALPIFSGLALSPSTVQLSAWSVYQPGNGDSFSRDADIAMHGTGTPSALANFRLVLISTGVIQDSFNFTLDDEEGNFNGTFDIGGQWPVGDHSIDIYRNGNKVYGAGENDVDIEIVSNPE